MNITLLMSAGPCRGSCAESLRCKFAAGQVRVGPGPTGETGTDGVEAGMDGVQRTALGHRYEAPTSRVQTEKRRRPIIETTFHPPWSAGVCHVRGRGPHSLASTNCSPCAVVGTCNQSMKREEKCAGSSRSQ